MVFKQYSYKGQKHKVQKLMKDKIALNIKIRYHNKILSELEERKKQKTEELDKLLISLGN